MSKRLDQHIAIQRLTALWALTESGLGGILHALNSSYTGLIVGSISIILVSLICLFSENKWSVLGKALILVLIVKFIVSPHSQITAYFAVSFQAISGYILYSLFPLRIACFLFPILALLESAFQRILVLAFIFGKTLSQAIDSLGQKVAGFFNITFHGSSTKLLIGGYAMLHIIIAIFIGWFCYKLIRSIKSEIDLDKYKIVAHKLDTSTMKKKARRFKTLTWSFLIILIGILVYGYILEGLSKGLLILSRTLLVISIWYIILSPILLKWIRSYLSKKQHEHSENIESIFGLFPYLNWIVNKVIGDSIGLPIFKRVYFILYNILMYSLYFRTETDDLLT